ncbi:C-type lectin mosGCTL-7-like [Diabrotica undecimpunctata]|uniref:C-type lectin mosGCTL-7-like n=1 Tax=Diabrotica undecimpunctata TaxID=50387 RepID=UPI003B638778
MKTQILVVLFTILFNVNINNAHLHQSDASVTPLGLRPELTFESVGGNTLYYFGYTFKGTWYQAIQHCKSLGMDLVSIETPQENEWLYQKMEGVIGKWGGTYRFWSSGTSMAHGDLIWMKTGYPIVYSNFLPQTLDIAFHRYPPVNETCVELTYGHERGLTWSKESLNKESYALCEATLTKSVEKVAHQLCNSKSLSVTRNHY